MPAYSNKYYDSTRVKTWSDLGSTTWADADFDWQSFSEPTHSSYEFVGDSYDYGYAAWVVPNTQITSSGVAGDYSVTVSYKGSINNVDWTDYSAGPMYGRYFKTVVTTAKDYLVYILTEYKNATITNSYYSLDTTTLSGSSSSRELPQTKFSKIMSATATLATSETLPLQVVITDYTPATFSFKVINLDSWGKVAVDATINLVIHGLPTVTVDTDAGSVRINS